MTNCKAFVMIMKKKDTCLRVARWALLLENFQYIVEHHPGTSMRHVDALSRSPVEVLCLKTSQNGLIEKIQMAQQEDSEIKKLFESVSNKKSDEFALSGQYVLLLLYRVNDGIELVVPRSLQGQVIRQVHDRGHFSWRKTEQLNKNFGFPGCDRRYRR